MLGRKEIPFYLFYIFHFLLSFYLQRARRNSCIEPTTGNKLTFLEIFPEDLLCHASALSSYAPASTNYYPLALYIVAATLVTIPNLFSYFYTSTSILL